MVRRGWGAHRATNKTSRTSRAGDQLCGQAIGKLDACLTAGEVNATVSWMERQDFSGATGEARAALRAAYEQAVRRSRDPD